MKKKQFIRNLPPLRNTVDNKERFSEERSSSADNRDGFSGVQDTKYGFLESSKKISGPDEDQMIIGALWVVISMLSPY